MFAKLQLFPVFKMINSCIYRYYKSLTTTCAFIPIHATKVAVKQINLNKWNSILLHLQHRLRAFISNQFIVSMSDILLYTGVHFTVCINKAKTVKGIQIESGLTGKANRSITLWITIYYQSSVL